MTEVASFALKADAECSCGCGAVGRALANGHIARRCPASGRCRSCEGRRNRGKGKKAEREMRRLIGATVASNMHAAIGEEAWSSAFLWEAKAGRQVEPIATRFLAAEAQAEASRAVGDGRPFGMLARPDRMRDGLVLVRGRVWSEVIEPALREFYGEAS